MRGFKWYYLVAIVGILGIIGIIFWLYKTDSKLLKFARRAELVEAEV